MEGATVRKIFVSLFTYLKSIGKCERNWAREELKEEYNSFKQWNEDFSMSFSNFLFKASRLKPPILRVRRGTEVILLLDCDNSQIVSESEFQNGSVRTSQSANIRSPFQYGQRKQQHNKMRRKRNSLPASNKADASANVSEISSRRRLIRYKRPIHASNELQTPSPKLSLDSPITSLVEKFEDTNKLYRGGGGATSQISTGRRGVAAKSNHNRTPAYTGVAEVNQKRISNDDHQNPKPAKEDRTKTTKQRQKKHNSTEQDQSEVDFQKRKLIPGVRPEFLSGAARTETITLKRFAIPQSTELEYRTDKLQSNSTLRERLSSKNYREKFHLLLHIEELQYRKEIQSYAMKSAVLQKKRHEKSLLYLEVPGLAENRPSLLVGDRVYAVRLDSKGNEYGDRYEGYVHGVEKEQVGLGFNSNLTSICQRNMKFRIRFTFNRRPLRLMHHALDMMQSTRLAEMLFPRYPPERYVPPSRTLVMRKRDIESNTEQRTAVENIVLGKTPPIYIIFGPPGTGKTVTMVEAIYQTYKRYNYNILVCALCNDACDMLASKLQEYVDKSKMIRIYAASRSWKSVPTKIKEGKTNYRDGELYMPEEEELKTFRIIICTFVTAGRISLMKLPRGHFQRIFVDESGQAFEPECLIAVSGILAREGKLILAGDPKQLGPIVRSPLAIRHGLQMSLLQRLMDICPLYQKHRKTGEYNPQCVTKLVKNYRSHEVILRISNQHFYDEELMVCADKLKRMKMCGWEWLKNKDFPILFHGIEGKQTRDQSSPSYYNPDEVKIVKDYVDKLMESRGTHKMYGASSIGIVTPYRKQCEKIRKAVERYPGIDVGSVEVFQGQERPVIIISTVRSSKEGLTDDAKYHLGFLCDPKRFNVALTRAQALLIIVGNPRLLCLDKYWKSLLEYCLKNKAYCGEKFSSEHFRGASDMEEIEELFRNIDITSHERSGIEDDLAAPFWRVEH